MNEDKNSQTMLTPGKILKYYRIKKELSIDEVSEATKIPREQIEAIENDNYGDGDSDVFYRGFIRNYADYLKLDTEKVLAIYRRTSAMKELKEEGETVKKKREMRKQESIEKVNSSTVNKVNRKKFVESAKNEPAEDAAVPIKVWSRVKSWFSKVEITPGLVATLVVTALILSVLTYLIIQFYKFQQTPELTITTPENGIVVEEGSVTVAGSVEMPAVLEINDEVVEVDTEGDFNWTVELVEGTNTIPVKAYKNNNEENATIQTLSIVYQEPIEEVQPEAEDGEEEGGEGEEVEPIEPEVVTHEVYIETTEEVWLKLVVDDVQKIKYNVGVGKTSVYEWNDKIELASGKPKSSTIYIDGEAVEWEINSASTGVLSCTVEDGEVVCTE